MLALLATEEKRPVCTRRGSLAQLGINSGHSGLRSAAKLPYGHERSEYFWCNRGANRVENMETMDVMDRLLSTL